MKSSVLIKEQMRNGPDITNDVMGKGMPVYHIKRVVEETGEEFGYVQSHGRHEE